MRLKICGITNKEDLLHCIPYVDAVGFIVGYPQSRRSISIEKAKHLISLVPPFVNVVVVIPDFKKVLSVYSELKPDTIQLHGKESVNDVIKIKEIISCNIIKACGISNAIEFSKHVDAILIDDKYEPYTLLDIESIIKESSKPVILAGHINPNNLLEILDKVQPYAIDVASGVEHKPGIKDISKIKQLRTQLEIGNIVGSIIIKKKILTSTFQLYHKLTQNKNVHIITEVKPASPSKGNLRNVAQEIDHIISEMEEGGASAFSVLIEPIYFQGSIDLIETVRKHTNLPIIAKGFIFTPQQISDIANAGANAFLLMVKVIESQGGDLKQLIAIGATHKLDVIVEVEKANEISYAIDCGASIVQINNRDIYGDLSIDFNRIKIGINIPSNILLISASGVTKTEDINILYNLSKARINAFLIGTSIMQSKEIKTMIQGYVQTLNEVCR
ncbi:hypothetical protein ACFL2V_12235 [Pseudomonadota bacterium]